VHSAALLLQTQPDLQFILPQAATIPDDVLAPLLAASAVPVLRVHERSYDILACCDAALVASGTATLETALMGVPMAVVYKVSPLTYTLLKPLIRIPDIALVNIVAGHRIVQEFVQNAAEPHALAAEVQRLLHDADYHTHIQHELAEVKARLGNANGVENMAALSCEMLGKIQN